MGNQPVVLGVDHPAGSRVMFTPLNSLHSFAGLAPETMAGFKHVFKYAWFSLYSTTEGRKATTSNFEHVFMGEVSNSTM